MHLSIKWNSVKYVLVLFTALKHLAATPLPDLIPFAYTVAANVSTLQVNAASTLM